jgi:hypothetical protein
LIEAEDIEPHVVVEDERRADEVRDGSHARVGLQHLDRGGRIGVVAGRD